MLERRRRVTKCALGFISSHRSVTWCARGWTRCHGRPCGAVARCLAHRLHDTIVMQVASLFPMPVAVIGPTQRLTVIVKLTFNLGGDNAGRLAAEQVALDEEDFVADKAGADVLVRGRVPRLHIDGQEIAPPQNIPRIRPRAELRVDDRPLALSGCEPRVFLVAGQRVVDVPLRCDTLYIDIESDVITLCWRGHASSFDDADYLVAATETARHRLQWPRAWPLIASARWQDAQSRPIAARRATLTDRTRCLSAGEMLDALALQAPVLPPGWGSR